PELPCGPAPYCMVPGPPIVAVLFMPPELDMDLPPDMLEQAASMLTTAAINVSLIMMNPFKYLHRASTAPFRSRCCAALLRASRYESSAATSSWPRRRLGMRTVLYLLNRAVAIGSLSSNIFS